MEILISKLERLEEEKKKEQLEKVTEKGEGKSWGNQIRNYVLHPYKLIKDLRTGKETSNVEDVLD
jgi:peptide chain release factor 2